MADTLDVVTLAEAKAVLAIGATDASNDTALVIFITAVSRRLDKLIGPIVQRTLTDELYDGGIGITSVFVRYRPVTSYTTVSEFAGTVETALTAETNAAKPTNGYLAQPYTPNPVLFSGELVRRSAGSDRYFAVGRRNVKVTYVAGRAADTASVDAKYKDAAAIMLQNLWRSQQVSIAGVDDYDVPRQTFPRFAVPNAVRELLFNELQDTPGFA